VKEHILTGLLVIRRDYSSTAHGREPANIEAIARAATVMIADPPSRLNTIYSCGNGGDQ